MIAIFFYKTTGMKLKWNKLFSLRIYGKSFDTMDKIKFTGCNKIEKNCMNYIPELNDCFRESDRHYKNRDFARSIEALEKAYNKVHEIQQPACFNCTLFLQATVVQSVEFIQNELEKKSKGIFAKRQYEAYYVNADNLLKKIKPYKTIISTYSREWTSSALQSVYH